MRFRYWCWVRLVFSCLEVFVSSDVGIGFLSRRYFLFNYSFTIYLLHFQLYVVSSLLFSWVVYASFCLCTFDPLNERNELSRWPKCLELLGCSSGTLSVSCLSRVSQFLRCVVYISVKNISFVLLSLDFIFGKGLSLNNGSVNTYAATEITSF